MSKKWIRRIVVSILLIFITVVSIILISRRPEANGEGLVTINLESLDNQVSTKQIEYSSGSTFWGVVKDNYDVRYTETQYGVLLYDIDFIKTDFEHTYVAIYLDGSYATVGVSSIELHDGLTVLFKETII